MLSAAPGGTGTGAGFDFTAWPPPGAEAVEVGNFYTDLIERGYAYGPAFQGARAVWRRGEEVFAEVVLPDEQRADAAAFGLHPALLDAALHPAVMSIGEDGQEPWQPGDWKGAVLHAVGASVLRVRLMPGGPSTVSLAAADEGGDPVVTVDSLALREVSAEQVGATAAPTASAGSLLQVDWTGLASAEPDDEPSWAAVATADDVAALTGNAPAAVVLEVVSGADADADATLNLTSRALAVVQTWLAGTGLEQSHLVVVTRGAVPAGGDGKVTDSSAAAVWGLVRAAQAENPGRIILLDLDPAADGGAEAVLGSVLASGEPQIAVRGTALSVPRLGRAAARTPDVPAVFAQEGTVMITGGGSLGALVARHVVSHHGVRNLVWASRRGAAAEGVEDVVAELAGHGAEVSVVACDLSDRDQVAALLASVPDEHRLTGLVHTAGVFDAGVIGGLTPDRLASVFGPKVDAVRHLDELTRDMDLDAFIVYSSVSSVFLGAGSSGYAAANAFLDGLMASRRAAGLPGLSLAWGPWKHTSGLITHLSSADQVRMSRRASRGGVLAISAVEGMELFDAAVGSGQALLVPVKLDLRGLRAGAAAG
ncbi:SDR family oxidoreductase, partial [Streptomyces sp. NPDC001270]|uniref:SDR family oxidoreductase n=1 Tax=Streptomyces sp. NPDC001270 TaxID=3364554 RepID=UPI0036ABE539